MDGGGGGKSPLLQEARRDRRHAQDSVVAYSVWVGLPPPTRSSPPTTVDVGDAAALVLDRNGVLHGKPSRLLCTTCAAPFRPISLLGLVGTRVAG